MTSPNWGAPVAYGRAPALPTTPREYHEFWRAPAYRWWKGLLALAALTVATLIVAFFVFAIGMAIDKARNGNVWFDAQDKLVTTTPILFLANNLVLAATVPISLLCAWLIVGQRPGWLSSVAGKLRWGWLGRCTLVVLPIWGTYELLLFFAGRNSGLAWNKNSLFMILTILLTTPLQAAGEEYFDRGLITRAVGSWIPHRTVSLIVAWLVSATTFTVMHDAKDPWLNAFYFLFASLASYLTWRTGGLEAAIVVHVTNNMLELSTIPFIDFGDLLNRETGSGSPLGLIVLVPMILVVVGIERQLRKHPPTVRNAPAAGIMTPPGYPGQPLPVGITYPNWATYQADNNYVREPNDPYAGLLPTRYAGTTQPAQTPWPYPGGQPPYPGMLSSYPSGQPPHVGPPASSQGMPTAITPAVPAPPNYPANPYLNPHAYGANLLPNPPKPDGSAPEQSDAGLGRDSDRA